MRAPDTALLQAKVEIMFSEVRGAGVASPPTGGVPGAGLGRFPGRLPPIPDAPSASRTPGGPGTPPGSWSAGCQRAGPGAPEPSSTPARRRGHRQYLRSGPPHAFPRFRATVHEVTQAFAAASREVLALEAELAGPRAQPLLADHLRRLQRLEQTHLATVALLQLTGTPEWLEAQEDTPGRQELRTQVIKTMEAISDVLQDLKFDAESAE
ncbi:required for excision 1-B domain-containing protein-like [Choloepus didactylus]|uniref:required for excision 1-B domain-containing protein-like n=1 Tax=Choloepus didactylus TaxID=27675 RepID=UPI00189E7CD6|nr:required for excision 1-B domain-containing protein-like [Choloepus didactylus]